MLECRFGWYKSFEVSCKGHPLSELSRTILPEKTETEANEELDVQKSEFHILNKGQLYNVDEFPYETNDFEKLVDYELDRTKSSGDRASTR